MAHSSASFLFLSLCLYFLRFRLFWLWHFLQNKVTYLLKLSQLLHCRQFFALQPKLPSVLTCLQKLLPFLYTLRQLFYRSLERCSEVDFHLIQDFGGDFKDYSFLGLFDNLFGFGSSVARRFLLLAACWSFDSFFFLLLFEEVPAAVVASRKFF